MALSLQRRATAVVERGWTSRASRHLSVLYSTDGRRSLCQGHASQSYLVGTPLEQTQFENPSNGRRIRSFQIPRGLCMHGSQARGFSSAETETISHINVDSATQDNAEARVCTESRLEKANTKAGSCVESSLESVKDDNMDSVALGSLFKSLQTTVNNQTKAIVALEDEIQGLKAIVGELQESGTKSAQESELSRETDSSTGPKMVNSLQHTLKNQSNAMAALEHEMQELKIMVKGMQDTNINVAQEARSKAEMDVGAHIEHLNSLQNTVNSQSKTMLGLQGEIRGLKTMFEGLQSSNKELDQESKSRIDMDSSTNMGLLNSLRDTVNTQSKAIVALEDEIQGLKMMVEELQRPDTQSEESESNAIVDSNTVLQEWTSFLQHLIALPGFNEFQEAGKTKGNKLEDPTLIKRALAKFSQEYDAIFKSLSSEDLQVLAKYGCPSDDQRTVASGKRLRNHVDVGEKNVCEPCVMQKSCVAAFVRPATISQASLADVMRILYKFFEMALPREKGTLRRDVGLCIQKLLKEIIALTTVKDTSEPVAATDMKNTVAKIVTDLNARDTQGKRSGDVTCEHRNLSQQTLLKENAASSDLGASRKPVSAVSKELASECKKSTLKERSFLQNQTKKAPLKGTLGSSNVADELDGKPIPAVSKEPVSEIKKRVPSERGSSEKQTKQAPSKGSAGSRHVVDELDDKLESEDVELDEDESDEDVEDEDEDGLEDASDDDEDEDDDEEPEGAQRHSEMDESTDDSDPEVSMDDEHAKVFDDVVKPSTPVATPQARNKAGKRLSDLPLQVTATETQKEFAKKTSLSELVFSNANAFRPRKDLNDDKIDTRKQDTGPKSRGFGNDQYSTNCRRLGDEDDDDDDGGLFRRSNGRDTFPRRGSRLESARGSSFEYGGGRRSFQDRSYGDRSASFEDRTYGDRAGRRMEGIRGKSYGNDKPRRFGRAMDEDESDEEDYRSPKGKGRSRNHESEQQDYRSDRRGREGGRGRPRL